MEATGKQVAALRASSSSGRTPSASRHLPFAPLRQQGGRRPAELQMSSKKVPFNRHKENEEARKKREEDEAARVYAEFVESFKGESTSGSKFVHGGVIDPNAKLRADSEGGKSKDGGTGLFQRRDDGSHEEIGTQRCLWVGCLPLKYNTEFLF